MRAFTKLPKIGALVKRIVNFKATLKGKAGGEKEKKPIQLRKLNELIIKGQHSQRMNLIHNEIH